jgi:hypothetical protein
MPCITNSSFLCAPCDRRSFFVVCHFPEGDDEKRSSALLRITYRPIAAKSHYATRNQLYSFNLWHRLQPVVNCSSLHGRVVGRIHESGIDFLDDLPVSL